MARHGQYGLEVGGSGIMVEPDPNSPGYSIGDRMRAEAGKRQEPPPRPDYQGNPFKPGSEHVSGQMWLLKHRPDEARRMIESAGLRIGDYPSLPGRV